MHFLVFQIFAHPARHVAQHFTFDHEVPHFPFIKIALHLRLGNMFLQTVGPGQAGQTPPQSIFSSSWFRMPSSQVSGSTTGQAGQAPPQSIFSSPWFRMPSSQVSGSFFICSVSPSHGRPPKRARIFTSRVRTCFPF